MKAFVVSVDGSECSEVVFAATRGQAMCDARRGDLFHDVDWVDLRARRAPVFDDLLVSCGAGVVSWRNVEFVRRARANGWHDCWRCEDQCEVCGLFAFDCLPESEIEEGRCGVCRGACATVGGGA